MKVYVFDVDETLSVADGPVLLSALRQLRAEGHVVRLCGNWAVLVHRYVGWADVTSFLGPMAMTKEAFLTQLRTYIPCEEVVMVGNVLGVSGRSDDQGAAQRAGVRFIKESDFAEGQR